MRFLSLCPLLRWPSAHAADLDRVDRTINKEPVYKGTPKYGLLVFGPEARTKVWVILDGTDLYVDKNGDNSLTADERFPQDGRELKEFDLPGGYKVKHIGVHRSEEKNEVCLMANVEVVGKYRQYCDLAPVENRKDAPIAHFDGPLKLGLRERNWSCTEKLVRGGLPRDLFVWVGTFDKANGCWVVLRNFVIEQSDFQRNDFPADLHPVAEIEFPPARPGEKPTRKRYELKERC